MAERKVFVEVAEPYLRSFCLSLRRIPHWVALCDERGRLLRVFGGKVDPAELRRLGAVRGNNWSEEARGPNVFAQALAQRKGVVVRGKGGAGEGGGSEAGGDEDGLGVDDWSAIGIPILRRGPDPEGAPRRGSSEAATPPAGAPMGAIGIFLPAGHADDKLDDALLIGMEVERHIATLIQMRARQALVEALWATDLFAIIAVDRRGVVLEANAAAARIAGLPYEEIAGRPLQDLVGPDALLELGSLKRRRLPVFSRRACTVVGGKPVDLELMTFPVADALGRIVGAVLVGTDVTEQVELRRQASELAAVKTALEGEGHHFLMAADRSGFIVEVGRGLQTLLGEGAKTILGRNLRDLAKGASTLQFERLCRQKESFSLQLEMPAREGRSAGLRALVSPVTGAGGELAGFLAICVDATEELVSRDNLRLLHRLGTTGLLASQTAHEIKNSITAIKAVAQLARLAPLEAAEIGRLFATIEKESDRLSGQLSNLLAFSRSAAHSVVPAAPEPVVAHVAELMKPGLRSRGIHFRLGIAPELPVISMDSSLMTQALLNLLLNAAQACEGTPGAKVEMSVGVDPARRELLIRIMDNGPGVDPEVEKRAFEPFFSTKPHGTGLGLTIASQIIREVHGGSLVLHRREEGGAEAEIRLAAAAAATG